MRNAKVMSLLLASALLGLASNAAAKKRAVPRKPLPVKGVVNINKAPLKKLMVLPYVGKSRARAIVKYRSKRKFRRPQDLMKVKGISKRTFKRIRRHVTVTGETTIRKVRRNKKRGKTRRTGKRGKSSRK